jgi:hypothetical protein
MVAVASKEWLLREKEKQEGCNVSRPRNNVNQVGEKSGRRDQWFSTRDNCPPKGPLVIPGDIFDLHNWEGDAQDF